MRNRADQQPAGALGVGNYSRHDVLRILQIRSHQLLGWERAGLIPQQQIYTFQDLGQLRTLRALRAEAVSAASIRDSILAMKAVAGMENPLLEARVVRTGTRIAFRHGGEMMDPIRRQLLFDFDQAEVSPHPSPVSVPAPQLPSNPSPIPERIHASFQAAVQAEESGNKDAAIALYEEILALDSHYAAAAINLGTLYFHLRDFARAEKYYRRATVADPDYVLAYFDLGNVLDELDRLDESIAAYREAIALAPGYADAHYNLALALEHKGMPRAALRHWHAYTRLDHQGPWAEHARLQMQNLLSHEKLTIASRANHFIPPAKGKAALRLV